MTNVQIEIIATVADYGLRQNVTWKLDPFLLKQFLHFFALTQKSNKKSQGKSKRSAAFAGPRLLFQTKSILLQKNSLQMK